MTNNQRKKKDEEKEDYYEFEHDCSYDGDGVPNLPPPENTQDEEDAKDEAETAEVWGRAAAEGSYDRVAAEFAGEIGDQFESDLPIDNGYDDEFDDDLPDLDMAYDSGFFHGTNQTDSISSEIELDNSTDGTNYDSGSNDSDGSAEQDVDGYDPDFDADYDSDSSDWAD